MAHHSSALKRIRQNEKRSLRNKMHRTNMRTTIKKFHAAVAEGDQDGAGTALRTAITTIAKTRSRGVIHAKNASRRISRLTVAYNSFLAAPVVEKEEVKVPKKAATKKATGAKGSAAKKKTTKRAAAKKAAKKVTKSDE